MWGTLLPNLGTLGLYVLELFAMYATDGRTDKKTDGQTDGRTKATLTVPFPTVGGVISLTPENKGSIITPSFNEIG